MPADRKTGGAAPSPATPGPDHQAFACDAMLGGLARWLRAAGYDASWREGIGDWELIRLALGEQRALLTSDTGIVRIGIVRDGEVPALFVPHGLNTQEQLTFVLRNLDLPLREPRCMACGGPLTLVPKEQIRDRVPPRSSPGCKNFTDAAGATISFGRAPTGSRLPVGWRTLAPRFGKTTPEPSLKRLCKKRIRAPTVSDPSVSSTRERPEQPSGLSLW